MTVFRCVRSGIREAGCSKLLGGSVVIRKFLLSKIAIILWAYLTARAFFSVTMGWMLLNVSPGGLVGSIMSAAYFVIPVVLVLVLIFTNPKQRSTKFLTYLIAFIVWCFLGPVVTYIVLFPIYWYVFGIPLFPGVS